MSDKPLVCDGSAGLFSKILTVLRSTGQVYCRMPLNLGLSDVSLIIGLGLWIFKKENHRGVEGFLSSNHISS